MDQGWMRTLACNGLGGGTAGLAIDLILYPIEVFKTRMQASLHGKTLSPNASFYQGFSINTMMAVPSAALYFSGFELGKKFYREDISRSGKGPKHFNVFESAFGGCVAEVMTNVFRTPLEHLKTRIQAGQIRSFFGGVKEIYSLGGVGGLYQGFLPLIARDVPFSMLQLVAYDRCRTSKSFLGREEWYFASLRGFICGAFAAALTTPLDVLKTLSMTHDTSQKVKIPQLVKTLWVNAGVTGFFKGGSYRMFYICSSSSVFFLVYEKAFAYFNHVL